MKTWLDSIIEEWRDARDANNTDTTAKIVSEFCQHISNCSNQALHKLMIELLDKVSSRSPFDFLKDEPDLYKE